MEKMLLLIAFLLLFILLFFTNIKIEITYKWENGKGTLRLFIRAIFGLVRIKKRFPSAHSARQPELKEGLFRPTDREHVNRKEGDEERERQEALKPIQQSNSAIGHLVQLHKIGKGFLKKVRVKGFEWQSIIGTKDAALTGIVAGIGWTMKGSAVGIISQYMRLMEKPVIHIQPVFNQKISETVLRCMLQVRLGHAIVVGIQLFRYWRKHVSKRNIKISESKEKQTI